MDKSKEKLLQMLEFFHSICVDNSLRYYMVGGTMLGAVRHQGFIPWDDDIDVGMPRKDYDILLNNVDFNNSKYEIEWDYRINSYTYPFAKMYDTTTTLIENYRIKLKRGIYIDVFPLDGIGNTYEESIDRFKKIARIKKLLAFRKVKLSKKNSMLKNSLIVLSYAMPNAILAESKLCDKLTAQVKNRGFDECEYVGNLVGAWGEKEIMKKSIFGTPKLYTFEGSSFYGVEKYDEYLTNIYGDWRSLPPEEKRLSHHDYYLDLDKPYK